MIMITVALITPTHSCLFPLYHKFNQLGFSSYSSPGRVTVSAYSIAWFNCAATSWKWLIPATTRTHRSGTVRDPGVYIAAYVDVVQGEISHSSENIKATESVWKRWLTRNFRILCRVNLSWLDKNAIYMFILSAEDELFDRGRSLMHFSANLK